MIVKAERAASEPVEKKAAKGIGVPPVALSLTAYRLWRRSLTEQRDAVVRERSDDSTSARSRQAIRGRVTRELIEEIREALRSR